MSIVQRDYLSEEIDALKTARSIPQIMGTLPIEHVTPGPVFNKTGIEFSGPFLIEYDHVKKPTIVKTYICVLSLMAVHLELVSDLTSEAFIA